MSTPEGLIVKAILESSEGSSGMNGKIADCAGKKFMTQVHACTCSLGDLLALPDDQAAMALHARMGALDEADRLHEVSYAERGEIALAFQRRSLWRHLDDPATGQRFASLTAWMSSGSLACRRSVFEAKRDMMELADVPAEKLRSIPKANIKVLKQLSTAVRNDSTVLEAARSLKEFPFIAKIAADHPDQHIEAKVMLRFSPDLSGAEMIEEAITFALEHDIAGCRDEACEMAFETALLQWRAEQKVIDMAAKQRMNTSAFQFPKPGDIEREPEIIRIYPDGREVLNKATPEGRAEYRRRTLEMLERQGGRCCLEAYAPMCPGILKPADATFDHEWGRGMGGGKRDDRVKIDGIWVNGSAHAECNEWKGSRYIDFNRTFQRASQAEIAAS